MHSLPLSRLQPPNLGLLSATVVSAELLRGTIAPCGPGVRGVGWPESASVRAATLHSCLPWSKLVTVLRSAAWVWGAPWNDDGQLFFSTLEGKRFLRTTPSHIHVCEFRITEECVINFNG